VFLPFLHRDRGTGQPIICYSYDHGLGVKWRDPETRKGVADAAHEANAAQAAQAQSGEENRLLYVAMTRAKDHMALSYSVTPKRKTGGPWAQLIAPRIAANLSTAEAPELMQAPPADAVLPQHIYFEDLPRESGELDASEIGTQVHHILAGIPVEAPAPEAVELADRFTTSALGKRASRAARKQHEYDFLISIDDLILRGQIDLWFEHNRELILVDYKTDSVRLPLDAQRVDAYALQLQLYAIALEKIAGRPVSRAYLHFLRPNEVVDVDLSPLQLNAAREHVRAFLEAQATLDYPLHTGDQCFRCDYYKEICPARRLLAIAVSRS
jgi:ATP-dependent exoDNAse (exonuclease V) beta subunit